jgi:hypothetical protein
MSDNATQSTTFPNAQPPGEIISGEELTKVVAWLTERITQYEADQSKKREKWNKWRRQLENEVEKAVKQYPIENASNVSVPLSQIHGQAAFAKIHGMYSEKTPFWDISSQRLRDSEAQEDAKFMTRYYDMLANSPTDLDLASRKRAIHWEATTMGTSWAKVVWTRQAWNFKMANASAGADQIHSVLHDGPEIVVIPLEDCLYDDSFKDINYMPLIAHVVRKPWHELKNAEANGEYVNVDLIKEAGRTTRLPEQETQDAIRSASPTQSDVYDIYECYFYWDTDNDGVFEDLVFTLHKETGTVLRQDYNEIGIRSFEPFKGRERTFSVDGRGSAQTCEYLQDEANAIHNLTNDNMKIANMKMFKARRSVLQANRESIRPGKIWVMDDPEKDMRELAVGEIYPSSTEREMMTLQYAGQATSINEPMRGFADSTLQSRDTFSGQQLRSGMGQGIISTIAEGIAESWSRVGLMIFFQLRRHREDVINNERKMMRLSDEEIARLDRILSTPIEDIRQMMNFTIRSTPPDETRQAKQQTMMAAGQVYTQYGQQTLPLAQQIFGPAGMQMEQQAPELYKHMLALYVGSTKFVEEVLLNMGIDDAAEYVPDIQLLEQKLQGMRTSAGGNSGTQLPGSLPSPGGGPGVGVGAGVGQAVPTGNQGVPQI